MVDRGLPHRRNFLLPGSGAETFDDSVTPAKTSGAAPSMAPGPLITFSQNAMGCEFQVLCSAAEQSILANAIADGFRLLQELEQQLSIYQPTSRISQLNQRASQQEELLDDLLFELFRSAIELSEMTDGAFDITANPLSRVWGFHRRQGELPAEQEIRAARLAVGFRNVVLDATKRSIRFTHPQTKIDLGGIGKGFALDRLCEMLDSAGAENFLIHGGQSSVLARGRRNTAGSDAGQPWIVGISHPVQPRVRLAELQLVDQAIGTSGSGRQNFVYQGRRYSHIIDPRSGWPPDHSLSATVIAPDAMTADALATGVFIMGPEATGRLCDNHPEVTAIVIAESKTAGKLKIETFNLSDDRICWFD